MHGYRTDIFNVCSTKINVLADGIVECHLRIGGCDDSMLFGGDRVETGGDASLGKEG